MLNLLLHACAAGAATLTLPQDPYTELFGATLHFGDFDRDGAEDIYVSDPVAGDRLLHNRGGGLYEDVTAAHGLAADARSLFALWFDLDADGALDLCVGGIDGSLRLLQNADRGHFVDVTPTTGLQLDAVGLDAEARDLDGDGRIDLHVSTELGGALFRNAGAGRFEPLRLPEVELTALLGVDTTADTDATTGLEAGLGGATVDGVAGRSASRAAAARARRSALAARLAAASDGAPGNAGAASTVPGSPTTNSLLTSCTIFIDDFATANCIRTSSVPTLGMLYPLSTELFVATAGNVGVGTTSPPFKLSVNGNVGVDVGNANVGTIANTLRFGNQTTGEAIGSKRSASSNQFGLDFYTQSLNRMVITNAGNVGIGTISPQNRFHVVNGSSGTTTPLANAIAIFENNGPVYVNVRTPDNAERSVTFSGPTLANSGALVHNTAAAPNGFELRTSNATPRLTLTEAGDVGIGTSNPENRLHVFRGSAGTVTAGGASLAVLENNANASLHVLTPDTNERAVVFSGPATAGALVHNSTLVPNGFELRTGSTTGTRMVVTSSGNVGIGTATPGNPLVVAGSVQTLSRFTSSNTGGTWVDFTNTSGGAHEWSVISTGSANGEGPGALAFRDNTAGGTRLVLGATGNVGIGTLTPLHRLDVAGDTRVTGTTRFDGNVHVDFGNTNNGTVTTGALLFGNQFTGEGIACRKNTGGVDENQLEFYTAFNSRLTIDNSGRVGIGRQPGSFALEVQGDACKTGGTGFWNICSDGRIKTDVQTIGSALATLDRLRFVEYRYTDEYLASSPNTEDKRYFNVIAQEYAQVFPEYVSSSDADGILKVDTYPALIHALAAVQELHGLVQTQAVALADAVETAAQKDAEIATLEERLARLEASFGRFAAMQGPGGGR